MGHYLGDYSKAQCMFWGKQQGCNFVASRCGTRRDDLAVQLDGGTAATGVSWLSNCSWIPLLATKLVPNPPRDSLPSLLSVPRHTL